MAFSCAIESSTLAPTRPSEEKTSSASHATAGSTAPSPPAIGRERVLSRIAVSLVGAEALLELGLCVAHILRLWVVARIRASAPVIEVARFSDALITLGGWAGIVLGIPTILVFLMWIYTAYENLSRTGRRKTETTPGWVVGAYFMPVMNIYYPYENMKELYLRSVDGSAREERADGERGPWTIKVWWLAFLVSGVVGWAGAFAIAGGMSRLEALETSSWFFLAAMAMRCLAAVLIMSVILTIDRAQRSCRPTPTLQTPPGV